MVRVRHRKKKPLIWRLAPGLSALLLAGGIGYYFIEPEFTSASMPGSSSVSNSVPRAVEPSLPTMPEALPADYTDTVTSLCMPFVTAKIECAVSYVISESEPVGGVVSQVPAPGLVGDSVQLVYSKGPAQVVVPILSGLSKADAIERLWSAGLLPRRKTTTDAPAEARTVVDTSVPPSTTVENGSTVDLTYSSGNVLIPNWIGKPKELVEAEANQYGIRVEFKERESPSTDDVVLKQDSAGKSVPFRTVIQVVVSKASEKLNTLPNVVGMTRDQAIALLASQGFVKITTVVNGTSKDAVVVSMKPEAGGSSALGNEIIITVASPQ